MATKFLEPGGDADFSTGLWTVESGAPSIVTDFVHGAHVKSIKYLSASVGQVVGARSSVQDAGARVSFYFYINAKPTIAQSTILGICQTAFGTDVIRVRITSAGVLQLWSNTAQLGSNGSTLSTGTWYRISLAYTVTSTTVNSIRLWKDGNLDVSVTNGTLGVVTSNEAYFGLGAADATGDYRTSDHYIDNSSSLLDPGNIWVTAKRPLSNGTTNQFTGSGTPSGYGTGNARYVNERPMNTSNLVTTTPTTTQTEEYSIEGLSAGDIDITASRIVDYMGWVNAKVASTSNTPVNHIIVGGAATTITLTTSGVFYKQIAGSGTYPAGNTDIGLDAAYTTTGHLVSMAECGVVVAYVPTTTQNNSAKANILVANTVQANSVKADILVANTVQANSAKANIPSASTTQANSVKANILVTTSQANSIKADILVANTTQANSVKANILVANTTQANSAKADIKSTTSQANSAKANILVANTTQANSAKADILVINNTANNSVKSDILVANTVQANSVKANIEPKLGNSVKANILVTNNTQDNTAKANILVQAGQVTGTAKIFMTAATVSTDDAGVDANGGFSLNFNEIYIGQGNGVDIISGLRWRGLTYKTGERLTSATLGVRTDGPYTNTILSTIYGDKELSPATFSTLNDLQTRPLTSNVLAANYDSGSAWSFNADLTIGDITSLFLEVVNQDGWADAFAVIWKNNGTTGNANRRFYALEREDVPTNTARLILIWNRNTYDNSVKANIQGPPGDYVKANIRALVTTATDNNVKANIEPKLGNSVKADILVANTTQTNSVKANILTTYTQNNSVKADILVANTTQTNSVKANILVTNTVSGNAVKANILVTTSQANSVKANIEPKLGNSVKADILVANTVQANSVKADILVATSQANSAKANILVVNNAANNSVKANILVTTPQNNSVKANILRTYLQDSSVKADILVSNTTQANSVKANILVVDNTDANSAKGFIVRINISNQNSVKADIKTTYTQDNNVKANIPAEQKNSVKANILVTTSQANSVKADIKFTTIQANSAKADILVANTIANNSTKADILVANTVQANSAKANIRNIYTQDNSVKANILVVNNTANNSVKANILVINNIDANNVKANIKATITQNSSVKANILVINNIGSNNVKADILVINNTANNSVKADIVVINSKDSSVKANILATSSQANSAKADITQPGHVPNYVLANIVTTVSQSNSAKANIFFLQTQSNSAKANIFFLQTQSNSAKANIFFLQTKDNAVLASLFTQILHTNSAKASIRHPIIYRDKPYQTKTKQVYTDNNQGNYHPHSAMYHDKGNPYGKHGPIYKDFL